MSERLSNQLAEEIDRLRPEPDSERLGAQSVRATSWRRDLRRRRLQRGGAGVAAITCALVGWQLIRPPAFELEGVTSQGVQLVAGSWLRAPADRSLQVTFNEGSRLVATPATRARVIQLSNADVEVAVEEGSVRSSIKPGRRWQLRAGPYRVRVIGTSFVVRWRAASARLEVTVDSGRVWVSGGNIDGEGLSLSAGQALAADPKRAEVRLRRHARADEPMPRKDPPRKDPATVKPTPTPSKPAVAKPKTPGRRSVKGSWLAHARARRYPAAAGAARKVGLRRLRRVLAPDKLLLLADALRFAGDLPGAIATCGAVRRRFPRSTEAAAAAFRLGRIAFDHQRDYQAAARWFEAFIRRTPARLRHLEPHALGRLVIAYGRSSRSADASRVAKRYLAAYPDGPYASAAKRALHVR